MTEQLRVCIDKELPAYQLVEAADRAVAENQDNDPRNQVMRLASFDASGVFHPVRMALLTGKKWAPGRTLRIAFLEGRVAQQGKVFDFAGGWMKHANIKFVLARVNETDEAEIRITFDADDGAWSYLGTDNLSISRGKPTMNLGWLDEAVVLHEFGHALGCIHEHQNPAGGILWNKEAAYVYYGRNGWTRQMVDQQVFAKYAVNITQFTATDKESIMMYPVPAGLTTNGFSTPGGKVLSAVDKAYIRTAYPGTVDPPLPPPSDRGDWAKVREAISILQAALPVGGATIDGSI